MKENNNPNDANGTVHTNIKTMALIVAAAIRTGNCSDDG